MKLKKLVFFTLALCFTFTSYHCFGFHDAVNQSIVKVENYKIYINPSQIHIDSNSISVNFFGNLTPVDNLGVDDQGIFFDTARARIELEYCPHCSYPMGNKRCVNPLCITNR